MDIEVNGINISVPIDADLYLKANDIPLHSLLRKGDNCEVNDNGTIYKGVVTNIVKLSKGRTLFFVRFLNRVMDEYGVFEGSQVMPRDAQQRMLRLTAVDMLLKRYEPKGMSTLY